MEDRNISFLDYIGELEDPRIERGKLHSMADILFLTLVGVISGCEGWKDIEYYGKARLDVLKKYLPFENGVPSDDTLRRFFRALDPNEFSKIFVKWVSDLVASVRDNRDTDDARTVAIDGKVTKRSFDQGETEDKEPLYLVNAFATDVRMVLCQKKVEGKSNEITAIPQLLDLIDICGAIVTIDAIGTQKKIAQKIIDKKGDYLLNVKGNQGDLLEEIKTFFEIESESKYINIKHDTFSETEKGHGRIEIRTCTTTDQIGWLSKKNDWVSLKSIACIQSERLIGKNKTIEKRYYITSIPASAERILRAARSHWLIENSMHWVLDVCFNDDQSRIRKGNAPQNVATIKSLALNLLKRAQPLVDKYISIKCLRKLSCWQPSTLELIVNQI